MLLQILPYYLANFHLANCHLTNYHLFLANCTMLFSCKLYLVLFLQRWALNYGLITCGADLDLKDFSSVQTHLNNLTFDSVSKIPFS